MKIINSILLIIILIIVVSLWFFRFSVTPGGTGGGIPSVYKLDRITGEIYLLVADAERRVKDVKTVDKEKARAKELEDLIRKFDEIK